AAREDEPEVGLVRALVLREARVAVDPEEGAGWVAGEREAGVGRLAGEVGHEAAGGPEQLVLEGLLARPEPVALVVLLEVAEELEAFFAEAGKWREVVGAHERGVGRSGEATAPK